MGKSLSKPHTSKLNNGFFTEKCSELEALKSLLRLFLDQNLPLVWWEHLCSTSSYWADSLGHWLDSGISLVHRASCFFHPHSPRQDFHCSNIKDSDTCLSWICWLAGRGGRTWHDVVATIGAFWLHSKGNNRRYKQQGSLYGLRNDGCKKFSTKLKLYG